MSGQMNVETSFIHGNGLLAVLTGYDDGLRVGRKVADEAGHIFDVESLCFANIGPGKQMVRLIGPLKIGSTLHYTN